MKCTVCRGPATIRAPRHNAAFCAAHFREHVLRQVEHALEKFRMLRRGEPLLLGVSGGKDSMVAWHTLAELGHDVRAVHLNTGFGDHSRRCEEAVRAFAARAGLPLRVHAFAELLGAPFDEALRVSSKPACSLCGAVKRWWLNRLAGETGCAAVATGHNLDDETAFLLGNVLHWQMDHVRVQSPAREAEPGLARKVKPLYRLTDEETRLFAEGEGLPFVGEKCPRSGGATSHLYKRFLDRLEEEMPGVKSSFLFGFLERLQPALSEEARRPRDLRYCPRCGYRTLREEACAVCALRERLAAGSRGAG